MECYKITYQTRSKAERAINEFKKHRNDSNGKRRNNKSPQSAYKCPECGMWHLTSRKP